MVLPNLVSKTQWFSAKLFYIIPLFHNRHAEHAEVQQEAEPFLTQLQRKVTRDFYSLVPGLH